MVLGSGSMLGYFLIGSLLALQSKNKLIEYSDYYGISVGSILAALIAMNISIKDIITESLEFNFFDGWNDFLQNFNILEWMTKKKSNKTMGLIDPGKIRDRIEYWMIIKYHKKLSFQDLYNLTGNTLTIIVTDRSDPDDPKPIYLNKDTYPNYQISKAVIESCSIPGIFEIENPHRIDGVFTDPFPVERLENKTGLALLLHEDYKITGNGSISEALINIYSSIMIPIKMMMKKKIEMCPKSIKIIHLRKQSSSVAVPVPIGMSKTDKYQMIVSGYFQTLEQLKKDDNEE